MQISDMLRQYDRNLSSSSTEELKGATGMQKLVSTVKELQTGNIFEGTVSAVKGGKVTLALGNGQTITAQMDGKVSLSIGTPMFFQVKNNDGNTVSIRPYLIEGNNGNPILLNALTTAGITVNERNLFMVDTMMKEQMPIDKQSILDMVKYANLNADVSVKTVVEMVKLGIPVSKAMAMQYENYLGERHSILQEMNQAMDELAGQPGNPKLSPEAAVRLNQEILDILASGKDMGLQKDTASAGIMPSQTEGGLFTSQVLAAKAEETTGTNVMTQNAAAMDVMMQEKGGESVSLTKQTAEQKMDTVLGHINHEQLAEENRTGQIPDEITTDNQKAVQSPEELLESWQKAREQGTMNQTATLGQVLSEEGMQNLNKLIQNIPTLVENQELFPGAEEVFVDTMQEESGKLASQAETILQETKNLPSLDKEMTVEQFLKAIKLELSKEQEFGFTGVQKLFASKEYRSLLKNIMEQEWLMKPQELTSEHKMNELYAKLEHQLSQMETAMQRAGMSTEHFLQTAAGVHHNIEFMNLINQTYTYVQLPLKLTNQNANSELYVYTNKKCLSDPDAEVTAFLHLDMEHLGATDVSVKLQKKHVSTNFYFSDDASYGLVKQYLPNLEERLAKKGYFCTFTVSQDEKEINFVEDFLRSGQPQVGTLQRYSFDIRA